MLDFIPPLKVLLVDDSLGASGAGGDMAREALAQTIGSLEPFTFCSAYDDFLGRYDMGIPREAIARHKPDVMLLDIGFGDQPYLGFQMLEEVVRDFPGLPVVMFSALDREANLERALERGAVDFLNKDTTDREVFWLTLMRYRHNHPSEWVIGQHGEFQQAVYFGGHLALSGGNLLIQGEDGAGKDRLLQFALDVARHLAGKDDILVLSDLDKLEASDQLMALRAVKDAMQAGRAIFATSCLPLIGMVKRGVFRRDLFETVSSYRSTGTAVVQLPPLRERKSDLPLLVRARLLAEDITCSHPTPAGIAEWLAGASAPIGPLVSGDDLRGLAVRLLAGESPTTPDHAPVPPDPVAAATIESVSLAEPAVDTQRIQITKVEEFLRRVASHEDAYQIMASGIPLTVVPGVFSPKYSHSSDFLIRNLPQMSGARVLDMGCGTGILGLACLKLREASHATFIDINPKAIENVQINLSRLNLSHQGRAMISDMFERVEGRFDVIVSNPPFWDAPARSMLERSCFDENFQFLRNLIAEGGEHLTHGGKLAVVMSDQSDLALLVRLLCEHHWIVQTVAMESSEAKGDAQHIRFVCIATR